MGERGEMEGDSWINDAAGGKMKGVREFRELKKNGEGG
jgi:hypothetical protein